MPIPDFVAQLRRSVGHDLLWLPSVTAVVVDETGRILLNRRRDTGLWSAISGILEPGEQPAAGIVREVFEETGVRVVPEYVSSVYAEPPLIHLNRDRSQYLNVTFRCRPVGGEAKVNDDESIDVAWFSPAELPALNTATHLLIEHALSDSTDCRFVCPDGE
ncbi:NUDIX domain-containing protein [Streptomyces sp. NBC_00873]|uniref:NUDIX hydrolase n=1 Tax=unclassified Streptomyces TaxID=2593676 RepID=UPI003863D3F7|nr:NUDIX domain-containing protein [Streptomyces sp. NBC_00873]WTA42089.1 NUDIX domain-containing protein [Streptomyces sp. NBC_00842]